MGLSGIGFTEILLILVVVLLLFGSKKLPSIASDLGSAIRDFRRAFSGERDERITQDNARLADDSDTAERRA
jgi:sec-independent protein translocase protein TatA